jgi:hypothetical protein
MNVVGERMESDVERRLRELRPDEGKRSGEKGPVLIACVVALSLVASISGIIPSGAGVPGNGHLGSAVFGVILMALYLLPAIIASKRGHKNSAPIFVVNLFLGWTVIGWVGCLAWGLSHQEAVRQ